MSKEKTYKINKLLKQLSDEPIVFERVDTEINKIEGILSYKLLDLLESDLSKCDNKYREMRLEIDYIKDVLGTLKK